MDADMMAAMPDMEGMGPDDGYAMPPDAMGGMDADMLAMPPTDGSRHDAMPPDAMGGMDGHGRASRCNGWYGMMAPAMPP